MKSSFQFILLCGIVLLNANCFSQDPNYFVAFDSLGFLNANSIEFISDHRLAIVGSSVENGPRDIFLLNTDNYGVVIWYKNFGSAFSDNAFDFCITQDTGYVIVGKIGLPDTISVGYSRGYMIRTDKVGNLIWSKEIERGYGCEFMSASKTNENTYIIGGIRDIVINSNNYAGLVLEISDHGELEWEANLPSPSFIRKVLCTSNGGYFTFGGTYYNMNSEPQIANYDSVGNINWINTSSVGINRGYFSDAVEDGNGDIIAVGTSFHNGVQNIFVVKLNSAGEAQWTKVFGGEFHDRAESVELLPNGVILVSGATRNHNSPNPDFKAYVLGVSYAGDSVGAKILEEDEYSRINDASFNEDGSVIATTGKWDEKAFIWTMSRDIITPAWDLAENSELFKVFPNPSSDMIYIESFTPNVIQVFNYEGVEMKRIKNNLREASIDLTELPSGLYFLQVSSNEYSFSRSIIKL